MADQSPTSLPLAPGLWLSPLFIGCLGYVKPLHKKRSPPENNNIRALFGIGTDSLAWEHFPTGMFQG
jgi:hypothetical protein